MTKRQVGCTKERWRAHEELMKSKSYWVSGWLLNDSQPTSIRLLADSQPSPSRPPANTQPTPKQKKTVKSVLQKKINWRAFWRANGELFLDWWYSSYFEIYNVIMLETKRWQENTKVSKGHRHDQETSWKYQGKMESSWRANGEHILVGFRLTPKWLPADP